MLSVSDSSIASTTTVDSVRSIWTSDDVDDDRTTPLATAVESEVPCVSTGEDRFGRIGCISSKCVSSLEDFVGLTDANRLNWVFSDETGVEFLMTMSTTADDGVMEPLAAGCESLVDGADDDDDTEEVGAVNFGPADAVVDEDFLATMSPIGDDRVLEALAAGFESFVDEADDALQPEA